MVPRLGNWTKFNGENALKAHYTCFFRKLHVLFLLGWVVSSSIELAFFDSAKLLLSMSSKNK